MKSLSMLASMLMLTLGTSFAHATVEAPVWQCGLTFKAKGGGIRVFVGGFQLKGPGKITCVDAAGNTEKLKINVTIGNSAIVTPNIAIGYMEVIGAATGVGYATSPAELLGTYATGGARAAFVVGAGGEVALHGTDGSATLNLNFQAIKGLGLQLGFDTVQISARK